MLTFIAVLSSILFLVEKEEQAKKAVEEQSAKSELD